MVEIRDTPRWPPFPDIAALFVLTPKYSTAKRVTPRVNDLAQTRPHSNVLSDRVPYLKAESSG